MKNLIAQKAVQLQNTNMAVGAYLKVISDNFRRAALDRHQEANMLRREITQKDRDLHDKIDQIERIIHQVAAAQTDSNKSDIEKVAAVAEVTRLKQEIESHKRVFNDDKAQLERQIQDVERDILDFNQKASEFLQRSAST